MIVCIFFLNNTITAQVTINEFMASNDQEIADEFGEFDDWIEIYNEYDSPINMLGLYLTDDLDDPTKWAFPDVTIPANGFLLIWADNDTIQGDFHAYFKLNNSGEKIGLFDTLQKVAKHDKNADKNKIEELTRMGLVYERKLTILGDVVLVRLLQTINS